MRKRTLVVEGGIEIGVKELDRNTWSERSIVEDPIGVFIVTAAQTVTLYQISIEPADAGTDTRRIRRMHQKPDLRSIPTSPLFLSAQLLR